MATLKVGDKVHHRGAFGTAPSKIVTVEGIEVTNGGKDGNPVDEIEWSKVTGRNVVVDLSSGEWAYANQISQI